MPPLQPVSGLTIRFPCARKARASHLRSAQAIRPSDRTPLIRPFKSAICLTRFNVRDRTHHGHGGGFPDADEIIGLHAKILAGRGETVISHRAGLGPAAASTITRIRGPARETRPFPLQAHDLYEEANGLIRAKAAEPPPLEFESFSS
jgi:hypothetical protein